MKNHRVSVIIRVYDRMEDLTVCVESIRKYWITNDYYLIIVSNGKNNGYEIPPIVKSASDCIVELEENLGHLKGNSQLLLAGIDCIPTNSNYTVILEADTWLFSDEIVTTYINKLDDSDSVWASAEWVKKYWSLALDFAIIKSRFIRDNKNMLRFNGNPEAYVCNYLLENKKLFIYIKENMPVHAPSSVRFILKNFGGRFRSFPFAKMITHHVEDLENGINTKKLLANYCLGKKVFPLGNSFTIKKEYYRIVLTRFIAIIVPQAAWIKQKKVVAK